jgi:hypothetical protein
MHRFDRLAHFHHRSLQMILKFDSRVLQYRTNRALDQALHSILKTTYSSSLYVEDHFPPLSQKVSGVTSPTFAA